METTNLYDGRVATINTRGLNLNAYSFCELRVDAGFQPEDPDHSRGYVRLELDRESELCGGIATRVLRAATVRNGERKDILEIQTKGDCETAALARALIFAGTQLLGSLSPEVRGGVDCNREGDEPAGDGVLHDSPSGSVWREAR